MRVKINIPEIATLREAVTQRYGMPVNTPRHFSSLSSEILDAVREYISETTLQRLWLYKTGYDTVAIHTLNVLSHYIGYSDWEAYCKHLKESSGVESIMFDGEKINVDKLKIGTKVRISWMPDRTCIIKYIGNFRFEAIETHNSKLAAGDTFTCTQMQLGREMCLDNLVRGSSDMSYVIGTRNGLTDLSIIED